MMSKFSQWLLFAATVVVACSLEVNGHCWERTYDQDSFVCFCNATCCDEPGILAAPEAGTFAHYVSDRAEFRIEAFTGPIENAAGSAPASVAVDTTQTYQTILGFGGAYTDAAGENFNSLSPATKEWLNRAYWSSEGNEYNIIRIPIGGSDCSSRPYTLDDVEGDVELVHWSLQPEDYNYKIPNVKEAIRMSNEEVLVFGSPWSPPAWMKSNNMLNGTGYLLRENWQPYANYIVKWAQAYQREGVPLWGLTPQNEPLDQQEEWVINSCRWYPDEMRDWIRDYLGPSLVAAGFGGLKMMNDDFNRETLPYYVEPCFADPECSKFVDGVAVHWYSDDYYPPELLLETRDLDPSKFLLYTEASNPAINGPDGLYAPLGNWERGEHYLRNIIEALNYYSVGWVDWNLALDVHGTPQWIGDHLDAAVIVNATADEFYKQPMFYAIAHVSKFFKRGDVRVDAIPTLETIKAAAVLKDDGTVAVVVLNMAEEPTGLSISVDGTRFINVDLQAKSFNSFLVPPA